MNNNSTNALDFEETYNYILYTQKTPPLKKNEKSLLDILCCLFDHSFSFVCQIRIYLEWLRMGVDRQWKRGNLYAKWYFKYATYNTLYKLLHQVLAVQKLVHFLKLYISLLWKNFNECSTVYIYLEMEKFVHTKKVSKLWYIKDSNVCGIRLFTLIYFLFISADTDYWYFYFLTFCVLLTEYLFVGKKSNESE